MDRAISALTGAADMELTAVGQRAGADRGDPQVSVKEVSNDGAISAGVWECQPGGWPVVERGDTEVATIISGAGTVTDADGTRHRLKAGSVITLGKGWSGRWDITDTLRKVYVIVK